MSEPTIQQLFGQAVQHHQAGRLREAERLYRQLLSLQPQHADAMHYLGVLAYQVGQVDASLDLIRRSIALRGDNAEAYHNFGIALQNKGALDQAIAAFRKAIELKPNSPDTYYRLGVTLYDAGQSNEAAAAFRQAIALKPDRAECYVRLGHILKELDQLDEAVALIRHAISLDRGSAIPWINLGNVLQTKEDLGGAIAAYERAVSLNPSDAGIRWNLCRVRILAGDFLRGWAEFESRLDADYLRLRRDFKEPHWRGEDPRGKTILLHAEGGFGDAINFIRYAPMVEQMGAQVLLECQPALVRLMQSAAGVSAVYACGQPLPHFDWQVPLQSLPGIFKTTLESVPNAVPYLFPPADEIADWSNRLAGDRSFKVGLCWSGSSVLHDERTHSLALFAPLVSVPGVTFYSLQKGDDASQPAPPGMRLLHITNPDVDFADTAAMVYNLDLVITVDTSIAHLAGSLGKPVWVLIPKWPDFRWLLHREDTPWYPTMRLFRQSSRSDWNGVVNRVVEALQMQSAKCRVQNEEGAS